MSIYVRIAFFIVSISSFASIANELDLSMFTTTKVNENVYVMAQDYGVNSISFAAVIGDNEVALISTMMKEYSLHVETLVAHITDKPIKYVLSIDGDYFHYFGSRHFMEKGAALIAHKDLIPDMFTNRILVDKHWSMDLGSEQIQTIATAAHTQNHMMIKLESSNLIFAGDAISFDWIVYSGGNGPDAHIRALTQILSHGNEHTRYYTGNWVKKPFGLKQDMDALINTYSKFVHLVRTLYQKGLDVEEIAQNEKIHQLLTPLADYNRQKQYLVHYVKDVLSHHGAETEK